MHTSTARPSELTRSGRAESRAQGRYVMTKIRNPTLNGRNLEPVGWRVRDAMSPFFTRWGRCCWALLLCDEGLAAFEWPRRMYWPLMLRLGMVAGLGHHPPTVAGDGWPLSGGSRQVDAPSALLFERAEITAIQVIRRRVFTNEIAVLGSRGRLQTFTVADPRKIAAYAERLGRELPVVRRGRWPDPG